MIYSLYLFINFYYYGYECTQAKSARAVLSDTG